MFNNMMLLRLSFMLTILLLPMSSCAQENMLCKKFDLDLNKQASDHNFNVFSGNLDGYEVYIGVRIDKKNLVLVFEGAFSTIIRDGTIKLDTSIQELLSCLLIKVQKYYDISKIDTISTDLFPFDLACKSLQFQVDFFKKNKQVYLEYFKKIDTLKKIPDFAREADLYDDFILAFTKSGYNFDSLSSSFNFEKTSIVTAKNFIENSNIKKNNSCGFSSEELLYVKQFLPNALVPIRMVDVKFNFKK